MKALGKVSGRTTTTPGKTSNGVIAHKGIDLRKEPTSGRLGKESQVERSGNLSIAPEVAPKGSPVPPRSQENPKDSKGTRNEDAARQVSKEKNDPGKVQEDSETRRDAKDLLDMARDKSLNSAKDGQKQNGGPGVGDHDQGPGTPKDGEDGSALTSEESAGGQRGKDLTSGNSAASLRSAASSRNGKPKKDGEMNRDDRPVKLEIMVEIEEGQLGQIAFREGDSPRALAEKFCKKHGLDSNVIEPLSEHIRTSINQIQNDSATSTSRETSRSGVSEVKVSAKGRKVTSKGESVGSDSSRVDTKQEEGEDEVSSGQKTSRPRKLSYQSPTQSSTRRFSREDDSGNSTQRSKGSKAGKGRGKGGGLRPTVRKKRGRGAGGKGKVKLAKMMEMSSMAWKKPKVATDWKKAQQRLVAPTASILAKLQAKWMDRVHENKKKRPLSATASVSEVFFRLYDAFERQRTRAEEDKARLKKHERERIEREKVGVSKRSLEMTKDRTAKEYSNYGELLYVEGVVRAEQKKKEVEKRLAEEKEAQVKELTLKPEISKLAKQLTRTPGQLWDRLLVDTDSKQRRIEELRQQMEEMEMGECTFKPQINPRTRVLVQERLEALKQHNIKYHDQLFKDAERRRQRQAEYSHWYPEEITFQPKLYKRARLNNEDEEREQEPVFERMYKLAPKLMEKKRAMRDAILNGVDPETGQPFFKPVTGRAPTFQRNTSALPIGEFLYGMRYDFDERKGFKAERARLLTDSLANKPYAGTKSQALLEKMKERRFQQIFEYLDKDQDGAVALDSADLDMLDPEVRRDIKTAARLHGPDQYPVNYARFVELMRTVLNTSTRGPRHYILPDGHKHKVDDWDDYTFAYKMSERSRALAARKDVSDGLQDLYERQVLQRQKLKERLEALKKQKEQQEMQECTFKPGIRSKGESRIKRFLHGGVTPKPVEERFATLEKELRDVHGLVLGDASNAADSTGPNSPGTLEAWAAAAGSLAAGLIKGTVSMTSSEAEHTETPTTMRKGEVGKAVSYGGRSEWGTGTEETEATSRTREATRAHTSKNTSRAANRSQGKTGSPPESPKRPHTGRAGGTVNGDGETETAQQENKGHELGESKRSGREAKFDLPVEELAAQHHFDTKPSSKVASKHTSKAPSAAPSRPETIRGRRPDDGTDVSVQSDATKVSSKAPSKATSKAVSKGVSQNGSNNNSPRQAKTPGRRMENGNWSESDHYGEKSEASTRQQDLFGGYSEVEASSDGEESEFKDAEEQSETRQVDGSSSPRGGYPKTPGSASEKKSVHSSEGGKRSERSQITNRRFEEGSETDVSTRGPTDELQKVGFDEDFDGKQ